MHERRLSEPRPYYAFLIVFIDQHYGQRAGELVFKGDEKAFENKIKACRFLLSVMGILSRSYGILHTSCSFMSVSPGYLCMR